MCIFIVFITIVLIAVTSWNSIRQHEPLEGDRENSSDKEAGGFFFALLQRAREDDEGIGLEESEFECDSEFLKFCD